MANDGEKNEVSVRSAGARPARIPPRWFVRAAWAVHRGMYAVTRGRFGLRHATHDRWGMLRLVTRGRRTGRERGVILAYQEDGPNLALVAMNGWADPAPAWWLNLQAHPDANVHLPGGERRTVTGRVATDDERSRLWVWFLGPQADAYAALRSTETPLIMLEPRGSEQ